MRQLFCSTLLITFVTLPAYGLVLQNEPPHSDASATSSPDVAPPSTYKPLTVPPPQSRQPNTSPSTSGQSYPPAGTQLTSAQRNDLLRQAQNLNPQQLEAIAKSFQTQQNAQPYPQSQSSGQQGIAQQQSAVAQQQAFAGQQQAYAAQQQAFAGQQQAYASQQQAYSGQQQGYASLPPVPSASESLTQSYEDETELLTQVAHQREGRASLERAKRDEAFGLLLEEVLPLSPDQIKRLHRFYDLTLQAKATPPNASPEPHFTSTHVRLDPGSPTPVVRLAAGFISSILFIDATGEPWPITAYSLGDPESFNIQWDQKTNVVFIQSRKVYAHGNLAVRLYGLATPIMITLVSGQKNVDFRVDMQVGERGPDAKAPIINTVYDAKVNPILINLLDGIPPKTSVKLAVIGGFGDAWVVDNKIYFRTKLTVLSPAWIATVASPDGTHVYEMMLTPHIVASQNGKTVDIKLSGL